MIAYIFSKHFCVNDFTRFAAKRDRLDYVVKDNVTGKVIGRFPHDPELPKMAEKYARAAAKEFNRLAAAQVRTKMQYKKRGGVNFGKRNV